MKTINIPCYRSDGVYIVSVEVPDDATKEEIHEAIESLDNKIKKWIIRRY